MDWLFVIEVDSWISAAFYLLRKECMVRYFNPSQVCNIGGIQLLHGGVVACLGS